MATERPVTALGPIRGGRAWVPLDATDELVAALEALGCEVVRSPWVGEVTWEAVDTGRMAVVHGDT